MNDADAGASLVKATYREDQMINLIKHMHEAGWVIAELTGSLNSDREQVQRIVWRKP